MISTNSLIRKAAPQLAIACPACKAKPGLWCTHNGTTMFGMTHTDRIVLFNAGKEPS